MKCRNRYSPRVQVITKMSEVSMTKQAFKDECDINNIVSKYMNHGIMPANARSNPQYGDFSDPLDYMNALNTVINAQSAFDALPSKLRARFSNDPAQFLEFVTEPSNIDEMVSLGLATKVQAPPVENTSKPKSEA